MVLCYSAWFRVYIPNFSHQQGCSSWKFFPWCKTSSWCATQIYIHYLIALWKCCHKNYFADDMTVSLSDCQPDGLCAVSWAHHFWIIKLTWDNQCTLLLPYFKIFSAKKIKINFLALQLQGMCMHHKYKEPIHAEECSLQN